MTIVATDINQNIRSILSSNPISFLFSNDFKDLVQEVISKSKIGSKFIPKTYFYSDFIIPRLYAIIKGKSQHWACEYLNTLCWDYAIKNNIKVPFPYKDGIRKRRLIPHQTDVDKFLRLFEVSDVKNLFGLILDQINFKILNTVVPHRTWTMIADNSKDPYYGKLVKEYSIGYHKFPGTRIGWFYQGITILSDDIHLFVDFHPIKKGKYRSLHIPDTFEWLKFNGVAISKLLVDREFYRAHLLYDMRNRSVPVIIPVIKQGWIKHRIEQFLRGKGNQISGNIISQSSNQYPNQCGLFVRLVLIGHDDRTAWEIKEDYDNGLISFDDAVKKIAGFYTTKKKWKNKHVWTRYITHEYKKRWAIETGFSNMNRWHIRFRNRGYTKYFVDKHINGIFYNLWQSDRYLKKQNHVFYRDMTLENFRDDMISIFENELIRFLVI